MFNHFEIPHGWSKQWTKYPEGYTMLEALVTWITETNKFIEKLNSVDADINSREKSADITSKRKLSPNGDFTGSLAGKSLNKVFADIHESLLLSKTIRDMVNDRESIGTIYDGGFFLETVPPTIIIEGGLF